MHILSSKNNSHQIGATKSEILRTLNVNNRNKSGYFQNLITNLSRYIEPLGLQIRYNPINSHWFISYDSEISDIISANPFDNKPRLAATLFCTLVVCLNNPEGISLIPEIEKIRKKKHVLKDLKDLEQKGYLKIDKDRNEVKFTPLIGYLLDLEKLFVKLALKTKQ
jgi:hypothetical protein